ncbi:MAG: hypothetical protein NTZ73_01800 [Candidatus Diapherotrites archaeon]|nr:hypothetical protein [Candidatus Diapherotrites archaeon]
MKRILAVLIMLVAMVGFAAAASVSLSLNSLETIAEGETVTLTATVTAVGDSVGNVSLQLGDLSPGVSTSDSSTQSVGTLSSGQSSSKSWTIRGDVAGTYSFNVTASGTDVSDVFQNASMVVNTAAFIEISDKTCSETTMDIGETITMNFIVKNTGGSSATVTTTMSGYSSRFTLTSGSVTSSAEITAGSQSSKSYLFTAASAGTATITATVTSTENNPTAQTCAVTINAALDTSDDDSETVSGVPAGDIILSRVLDQNPSVEEITAILSSAGLTQESIDRAVSLLEKIGVKKEVIVRKRTLTNGTTAYTTTITFTIKNKDGTNLLKNVKVILEIPKTVAENASELVIPSNENYTIIKADPILEFEIAEIAPNGTGKVDIDINKQISGALADSILQAVVADFEEAADLCVGKNCDDENPCTTDACSGGNCSNTSVTNGTVCGEGKSCKAGACVLIAAEENQEGEQTPEQKAAQDQTNLLLIIGAVVALILIIAIIGAIVLKKRK